MPIGYVDSNQTKSFMSAGVKQIGAGALSGNVLTMEISVDGESAPHLELANGLTLDGNAEYIYMYYFI